MARILGVDIPGEKRIDIALRYVYGIGPVNALEVLERAKIDPSVRAKDLNEQQLSQIVNAIDGKTSLVAGPEMTEALNILSLVLDPGAPLSARRVPTYLAPILEALDGAGQLALVEGLLHQVDESYFQRIEAIEFTVRHDDGRLVGDLDKAALMQILTEPKNALIRQYQRLFEFENVRLRFSDDALETENGQTETCWKVRALYKNYKGLAKAGR
jgi:ribosomal protein S13